MFSKRGGMFPKDIDINGWTARKGISRNVGTMQSTFPLCPVSPIMSILAVRKMLSPPTQYALSILSILLSKSFLADQYSTYDMIFFFKQWGGFNKKKTGWLLEVERGMICRLYMKREGINHPCRVRILLSQDV